MAKVDNKPPSGLFDSFKNTGVGKQMSSMLTSAGKLADQHTFITGLALVAIAGLVLTASYTGSLNLSFLENHKFIALAAGGGLIALGVGFKFIDYRFANKQWYEKIKKVMKIVIPIVVVAAIAGISIYAWTGAGASMSASFTSSSLMMYAAAWGGVGIGTYAMFYALDKKYGKESWYNKVRTVSGIVKTGLRFVAPFLVLGIASTMLFHFGGSHFIQPNINNTSAFILGMPLAGIGVGWFGYQFCNLLLHFKTRRHITQTAHQNALEAHKKKLEERDRQQGQQRIEESTKAAVETAHINKTRLASVPKEDPNYFAVQRYNHDIDRRKMGQLFA